MLELLIILFLTVLLLFLLYLLVFIRPKKSEGDVGEFLESYAHRGLHGGEIPENSLLAFKNAVDNGFGIELDVQLSKDGTVMVFHDYSLLRMTGCDKKLCELDYSELSKLCLAGTDEKIPTFAEVLSLVDGKVPLLVELKGEDLNDAVCGKTAELLRSYKGGYCIESFNPFLLKKMKRYLPHAFYGQLYTNVCRDKNKISVLNVLLSLMAFNFMSKPNFIAYNKADRASIPVKLTTRLYKAYNFVWTLKTEDEYNTALKLGEYPIFEREPK